jgi:fucose permease
MALFPAMMVAALLVAGMGVAVLGSIKVPLAQRLHMDEARVGGLVSIFGFVMMLVILSAGFLTDHVGKQGVLISGSALFGVSLLLLAWARDYALAFVAVVLLGGAWSLLINVGNVLTPLAFSGGMAYATNLANVFFGLGAFLTPLLVAYLVGRASLPVAVSVLAVAAVIPAVLATGVDFAALAPATENGPATNGASGPGLAALLADPLMWLCGLALFFYAPLEASMGAWTTTYLGGLGMSQRAASGWLSGFWLCYMVARLATAFGLPPGQENVLILVLALASVGILLGIVFCRTPAMATLTVLGAGLVFGPIFPTLMAVLLGHFAPSVHGRAVGVFFTIGGVGWTLIPILLGAYARRTSVQRGFAIAVVAAVGLCVVALLLVTAPS